MSTRMEMKTTKIGRTAAEMTADAATQQLIRAQPGYRRGERMRVMRVAGRRAYRLYIKIGERWMDGSLADIEQPR